KEKGFDVVVLSAPGKEIEQLCKDEEAIFVSFPFRREIAPLSDLKALFRLQKLIRQISPTIINTGTPKAGLLVSIAAKMAGFKPVIFTLRGLRSETLSGLKKALVQGMETLTCQFADIVIPVSPSLGAHAQKKGIVSEKKSIVLGVGSSNGVNIEKFTPSLTSDKKMKARCELGINDTDFVISYIGRINNDKGVVELFQAFRQLANTERTIKLLIV